MMPRFKPTWVDWVLGVGLLSFTPSLGLRLVENFLPGMLPLEAQNAGLIIGLLLLISAGGFKQIKWLSDLPAITKFHISIILCLQFATVSLMAMIFFDEVGMPRGAPTAREVAIEMAGGDNFCYFHALLNEPQPRGGFQWQLSNRLQRKISGVKMCAYEVIDGERQYRGCWEGEQTCVPDSINQMATAGSIKAGEYYFKFFSINEWEQRLKIFVRDGIPQQEGAIYRNGREIARFVGNPGAKGAWNDAR